MSLHKEKQASFFYTSKVSLIQVELENVNEIDES